MRGGKWTSPLIEVSRGKGGGEERGEVCRCPLQCHPLCRGLAPGPSPRRHSARAIVHPNCSCPTQPVVLNEF
jgi:hypothetical protein